MNSRFVWVLTSERKYGRLKLAKKCEELYKMIRKQYEMPYINIEALKNNVLTLSTEPEDEKTAGDMFAD